MHTWVSHQGIRLAYIYLRKVIVTWVNEYSYSQSHSTVFEEQGNWSLIVSGSKDGGKMSLYGCSSAGISWLYWKGKKEELSRCSYPGCEVLVPVPGLCSEHPIPCATSFLLLSSSSWDWIPVLALISWYFFTTSGCSESHCSSISLPLVSLYKTLALWGVTVSFAASKWGDKWYIRHAAWLVWVLGCTCELVLK